MFKTSRIFNQVLRSNGTNTLLRSKIGTESFKFKAINIKSTLNFTQYRKPSSSWYKTKGFEQRRRVEGIWEAGLWMFTFWLML